MYRNYKHPAMARGHYFFVKGNGATDRRAMPCAGGLYPPVQTQP